MVAAQGRSIKKQDKDDERSLVAHLGDIRKRLVIASLAVGAASVIAYLFVPAIIQHMANSMTQVVFLSPAEAFMARIRFAVMLGFTASLPVTLYQVWVFIAPALRPSERRTVLLLIPVTFALFAGGASFAYLLVLPAALKFFLGFGSGILVPMISIGNLVSFATGMMIPFGLAFELPVVVMVLSRLGILSPQALKRNRRLSILVIFIAAAVLTPSHDMVSQLLLAGPLLVLHEVSVVVASLTWRQRGRPAVQ